MEHNFIHNKYSKIYFKLIDRAHSRSITGYVERHHVIPKCLGGTNDKSNIVKLTAREHFICHLLLTKMVEDKKHLTSLRFALAKFRQCSSKQSRIVLNSWEFEQVRKAHSLAARDAATGRKMPPRTAQHRANLSAARKGKPSPLKGRVGATKGRLYTEDHKLKMSLGHMGIKMELSDEERARRAAQLLAVRVNRKYSQLSDETKQKISKATKGRIPHNKGVPSEVYVCPHCQKAVGGKTNFFRWHNDNCRFKSSASE